MKETLESSFQINLNGITIPHLEFAVPLWNPNRKREIKLDNERNQIGTTIEIYDSFNNISEDVYNAINPYLKSHKNTQRNMNFIFL
ncbi:hypothetical protein BpHYR1_019564 [Brachionus plicatilis]|uniref:Uncharacterized protein n=1 Tax=Brachionus plicatilis TaxID=10195 RepID=A0A3M7Q3D9_BRAPC|nr:hypothetical protein BpHYR1_019564 [Brachionus plicatilis]